MVISLISFCPPVIKMCAYILTSVNSYLIMQSLNVLLTFLPLLLAVKQEFPAGGTIISILSDFRSDLKEMPFVKCPEILSHDSMISTYMT